MLSRLKNTAYAAALTGLSLAALGLVAQPAPIAQAAAAPAPVSALSNPATVIVLRAAQRHVRMPFYSFAKRLRG